MKFILRFLSALLVSLLFFVTNANALATVFLDISCAEYVEKTSVSPSTHAYNWFVAGYLSGINVAKNRDSPADSASYRVWLTTYCQKKPFDNFLSALSALDKYLGEGKNKEVSTPSKAL